MEPNAFRIYLAEFQRRIMIAGYERGLWRSLCDTIEIRPNRLERAPIGRLLGSRFLWDEVGVIDYYGYRQKSTAFMARAAELWPWELKRMSAIVLPFQSVKNEHVLMLAADLAPHWLEFRERIRIARWENSNG